MEKGWVRRISQARDLSKPSSRQRHNLGIFPIGSCSEGQLQLLGDDCVPDMGHLFSHPG